MKQEYRFKYIANETKYKNNQVLNEPQVQDYKYLRVNQGI